MDRRSGGDWLYSLTSSAQHLQDTHTHTDMTTLLSLLMLSASKLLFSQHHNQTAAFQVHLSLNQAPPRQDGANPQNRKPHLLALGKWLGHDVQLHCLVGFELMQVRLQQYIPALAGLPLQPKEAATAMLGYSTCRYRSFLCKHHVGTMGNATAV